jgi:hypothetical protein
LEIRPPDGFTTQVPAALEFASDVLAAPIVRDDELACFLRRAPTGLLARREYSTSLAERVPRSSRST